MLYSVITGKRDREREREGDSRRNDETRIQGSETKEDCQDIAKKRFEVQARCQSVQPLRTQMKVTNVCEKKQTKRKRDTFFRGGERFGHINSKRPESCP